MAGFSGCCARRLDDFAFVVYALAPRMFVWGRDAGGGAGGGQQDVAEGDGVGRCPRTQRRSNR